MNTSISKISIGNVIFVSIMSLVLAGCNQANSEITSQVVKPVKLIEVPNIHEAQYDRFIAEIDATHRASLSFQVGGELASVNTRMGKAVKKGDILATIAPRDFELVVDARQAEFELANTQYIRAQQLIEKRLISKDSFDQASTIYKAAEVALNQAKTDLNHTVIVAPFDGVVSIVFAKKNQIIGSNQPVMNIIDNSVMDVAFTIPSSYVEKHGLNMVKENPLFVVMDSRQGTPINAYFKEISTQPNIDTNSYTATATIKKPRYLNLLSGMTGQVKILNSKGNVSYQPNASAWVTKEQTSGVLMRFDPSTEMIHRITVGLDEQGNITHGLEQGDLLVEAGINELIDGQRVKVWVREAGI